MNPEEARELFAAALRDELSPRDSAAFEAALDNSPTLAHEFEDYADAAAGVSDVDGWLRDAGRASDVPDGGVYSAMTARIVEQATSRQRGRLIRLAAAVGGMAAAAAIVAVVFIHPGQQSVNHAGKGGDAELAGPAEDDDSETARSYEEEVKNLRENWVLVEIRTTFMKVADEPLTYAEEHYALFEGKPGRFTKGAKLPGTGFTIVAVIPPDARDGRVGEVKLRHSSGEFCTLQEHAAEDRAFVRIDLNKDGKLDADEVPQFMIEEWDNDESGDLNAAEFRMHHKPPPLVKPEDEFKRLDTNDDGKLDGDETRLSNLFRYGQGQSLRSADEDSSGDISLDEFRKHWKPRPPRPEEEFKRLDHNADEALDATEVPRAMVKDWDTDRDGRVTLEEFRTNFKPPRARRHGADGERRDGPPPQGEGDRPPRGEGPEGDGDRPPRREGPPPRGERPPREGDGPPRGDRPPPRRHGPPPRD